MLLIEPVYNEAGEAGLQINFNDTPMFDLFEAVFLKPGILQDAIHDCFTRQGMGESEAWKHTPAVFNCARDHIKHEILKSGDPFVIALAGLTS